jgi:hypothetical protein
VLLAVTVNIRTDAGALVWYPFEHPAGTLDDFHAALNREGVVNGVRFETRRGPRDTLIVIRRIPTLLSKAALFSVTALSKALVNAEGEPL